MHKMQENLSIAHFNWFYHPQQKKKKAEKACKIQSDKEN